MDLKIAKIERIFCIVTGVIALCLIVCAFVNYIFIPASCIMSALCLFSVWYIIKDIKKYKSYSLIPFIVGIMLVVFAVIYTIVKTR